MKPCPFGGRSFANKVPIKLHRFVDHGRKLANDQVKVSYFSGAGILCVAQGDLQDALGNHKLVHSQINFFNNKELWFDLIT
jgi:hypothetical protein